jgi:hypothetical protein
MMIVKTYTELSAALAKNENAEVEIAEGAKLQIEVSWGRPKFFCPLGASLNVTASGDATVAASGYATVAAFEDASVTAYDNARVRAFDGTTVTASGRATVEAFGDASVTAYDNVSVTASGRATVAAYDSVSVTAYGHVFVRLFRALKVLATDSVIIAQHGKADELRGGRIIVCQPPADAGAWCEHHGVEVKNGTALLYKGVDADFRSERGGVYAPGTVPAAPDWDNGRAECGGGLHFSPHPTLTRLFCEPEKFVACPVSLADMRAPRADDFHPSKIKAKGCSAPVWEVDEDGARIAAL